MKYVFANWKMQLSLRQSVALAKEVAAYQDEGHESSSVVLLPSFPALRDVHDVIEGSRIHLGAQNVGCADVGAYTGDVSVGMLEELGCQYALIGHSERRSIFEEGNTLIRRRFAACARSKTVTPVLCVGESEQERRAGGSDEFIGAQLQTALKGVDWPSSGRLVIAYEPLWAIGTGEEASAGQMVEILQSIRKTVEGLYGERGDDLILLYGGSVDAENAFSFLRESDVDGVLVGGASLKIRSFQAILEKATEVLDAQRI